MIYTVTFNPALDYVLKLDALESKDVNRALDEQLYYGGKGINVSVILSRLGAENEALGFLAGFSGRQIEQMLDGENVKNDFVYLKKGYTRINVKIKAEKDYEINARGPEIDDDEVEALTDKLSKLKSGDFLVLAGSVTQSLDDDIYEKILEKFQDKGINFALDATGDLLLNALKYKPFLVKPNHHELGDIFGVEIKTLDDIETYGKKLQDMGARNVLVSRSKDGAALIDENGKVYAMGNVPGKPINPVGCGDSMVAGFIAGYAKTKDYYYALRLGSACGNATAFCSGLADRAAIDKMLESEYLK